MCLYSRGKEAWEPSLELSARKGPPELSVVAHAHNSSTQRPEEGGSELEASPSDTARLCFSKVW